MAELEYDSEQPYLGLIEKYRPKPDTNTLEQQKRLAKGSALADAFRLLIDAVGGSKGADIPQRNILDPVSKAVDKYNTTREKNRLEQQQWDQTKLMQELKSMDKKDDRKYQDEVLGKQLIEKRRTETADRQQRNQELGVSRMNRAEDTYMEKQKLKQQNDQFLQEYGLKRESEQNNFNIKKQQANTNEMKVRNVYRYGKDSPVVSDPDIKKEVIIPKDKANQVLTWIADDPIVKGDMTFLQMQYGEYPSETQRDMIIADAYDRLSPETRAKIRQFVGDTTTAEPQSGKKPADEFLFYKTPAQQKSQGPASTTPAQPAIKTSKKSTIVEVEGAPPPARVDYNTISSDEQQQIMTIGNAEGYTPEQKAKIAYDYMLKIGFDDASARSFAQGMLERLLGKLN